jgi:predicted dehydrogenase
VAGQDIRMVVLGTGNMAKNHVRHFAEQPGVTVVGAVDVRPEVLAKFQETHKIEQGFGSLEAALSWGEFDAIANVTPDNMHHSTTMLAMAAGKHIFCEKPLATDYLKAKEMADAAEKAGLINMVNLTYRNVAELQKVRQLVRDGAIGKVRHVEASYLQSWLTQPKWGEWTTDPTWLWRLSRKHGSNGVLGDIGIHILDFASYGANSEITEASCRLQTFHKAPGDKIGDYDLDANDSFAMTVQFENGAIGVVHASRFATGHLNDLRLCVYGTTGAIEITHAPHGNTLRITQGEDIKVPAWKDVEADKVETNYVRFIRALRDKKNLEPSFAHAANLQKLLDLGLATEGQKPLAG